MKKSIILNTAVVIAVGFIAYTAYSYTARTNTPPAVTVDQQKPTQGTDDSNGDSVVNGIIDDLLPARAGVVSVGVRNQIAAIASSGTPNSTLDESQHPIGRYRNQVFSDVIAHKNIAYKSTYLTKLGSDGSGNILLERDTDAPTEYKVNIYEPAGDTLTKRPLLIFMYGGGWTYGDRDQREPEAIHYAKMGYVTMTFDYTMVPPGVGVDVDPIPQEESLFYTALIANGLQDIDDVYNYVLDHKQQYGIDNGRIGLGGWSVGGLMTLAYVHSSEYPYPFGIKGVLAGSSIFPFDILQGFGGARTFTSAFSPKSLMASFADDEAQNGPYSPDTDCIMLDEIGHECRSILFPGNFHEIFFHLDPLLEPAVDFYATDVAGY